MRPQAPISCRPALLSKERVDMTSGMSCTDQMRTAVAVTLRKPAIPSLRKVFSTQSERDEYRRSMSLRYLVLITSTSTHIDMHMHQMMY